jgi:broad specificity phosphatase PhoE
MPLRLSMICHGQTGATKAAAFALDEPIEAGRLLKLAPFRGALRRADDIRTSPALRARQTAAALALHATVDPELRDCDQGRWAGRTLAEVEREEPDGIAAWLCDPDAAPHGGESLSRFYGRIADWMDRRETEKGHVIAITHPGVVRAAILKVLDAPLQSFWRIDIEPLSLTDLRHDGYRWVLRASGKPLPQRADA